VFAGPHVLAEARWTVLRDAAEREAKARAAQPGSPQVRFVFLDVNRGTPWWFTFGCGQKHPKTGVSLGRWFVVLRGSREAARLGMFARFGAAWGGQYASAEEAGVAEFGLIELRGYDALGKLA
jgi:hypothetical protein